jgi:peptidoglycan hydrolase CwlO-like protein
MLQLTDNPIQPAVPSPPPIQSSDISRIVNQAVGGVLQSVQSSLDAQLQAEIAQRSSLEGQLNRAQSRADHAQLVNKIDQANSRIDQLRARIEQLRARMNGGEGGATYVGVAPPPTIFDNSGVPQNMVIAIVGIIFIGFPLAIAFARLLWRRGSAPRAAAAIAADSTRRFDQLEQSVDAIAIEIERISENQRYLTKVLSEPRHAASVAGGNAGGE